MISGIYKIVDLKNRIYVGSSVNIEKRKREHMNQLISNSHTNKKLQDYFKKHGIKGYSFYIIERCSIRELLIREQFYLDTLKPWYNVNPIASKPPSAKGRKQKPETIEKIRLANIGRKHTEETIIKIKKFRSSSEGKELQRKNAYKLNGFGWLGKSHTVETKAKIGAVHKGKIVSEETRQKLRLANIGKSYSDAARKNMSNAQKGRKHSPETIAKLKLIAAQRIKRPDWSEKMRQNAFKKYNKTKNAA